MRARIIGTGSELPEPILTSAELEQRLEAAPGWIAERTGIRERRVAPDGVATSDLAAGAARKALAMAGVAPEELDLIVVGTVSGDTPTPSTAAFVQAKLGARNAFAFDVSAACSGALYALTVADQFIRTGRVKRALVIGAEICSRFLDWKDRTTCVIFGDGAGAMVLAPTEEPRGVLSSRLGTDGTLAEILWVPGLGTRHPASAQVVGEGLHRVHMNGKEVFRVAVRTMVSSARQALEAEGLTLEQVDHVFSHQANLRIVEAVVERLGVPREKCHVNVDRYGNTSAASIPILLDEANRAGKLRPGDLCLMMAVGAGVAWGSVLVRW